MAKKNNKQQKKQPSFTFMDIVKGNFLYREEVMRHKGIILTGFCMLLGIIYINHLVSKKEKIVRELKEQAEEYKSRNAYAQSRLIKIKLESELGKAVLRDSLKPLESHPHKLLIKIDSTDAEIK